MADINNRIKDIRLTTGLNQEKFGQLFDPPAPKSAVSRWENNGLPNAARLKKIAEIGDTSVNYLLYGYDLSNEEIFIRVIKVVTKEYFKSSKSNSRFETNNFSLLVNTFFDRRNYPSPRKIIDNFIKPSNNDIEGAFKELEKCFSKYLQFFKTKKFIDKLYKAGAFKLYAVQRKDGSNKKIWNLDEHIIIKVVSEELSSRIDHLNVLLSTEIKPFSKITANILTLLPSINGEIEDGNYDLASQKVDSIIDQLNRFKYQHLTKKD